jgi:hypothetical protein
MSIVSFLREAKIADYTNIMSNEEVLKELLANSTNRQRDKETGELSKFVKENKDNKDDRKNVLNAISDVLQSITTEAITTSEMLEIIYNNYDKEIINHVSNFIKVVHASNYALGYENVKKETVVKEFSDTPFAIVKKVPAPVKSNSKKKRYIHDSEYGLLGAQASQKVTAAAGGGNKLIFNIEDMCFAKFKDTKSKKNKTQTEYLVNNIKNSKVISNKLNPSMSFILVDSPDLRIGTRNSLELATFFNLLSTIELSKCQPYFNATFVLPSIVENQSGKVFKTASINQFLDGTPIDVNMNSDFYNQIDATFNRTIINTKGEDIAQESVNTNLSAFTMPQTINNFNEIFVGHNENVKLDTDMKFLRSTSIHDITRPFMTIKSFSIDVAPTQGLLSFKTGKLSLILHDRTRMVDIAPFIKPDLFGSFGAEIAIEYGWSHTDSMLKGNKDTESNTNYLAEFLNASRVTEKYIITNSSFSMDNNGQVNIDLSIAMRGPVDIRSVVLKSDPPGEINKQAVTTKIKSLNSKIRNIQGRIPGLYISENITQAITNEVNAASDNDKELSSSDLTHIKAFVKINAIIQRGLKSLKSTGAIITRINEMNTVATNPISITFNGTGIAAGALTTKDLDDANFGMRLGADGSVETDGEKGYEIIKELFGSLDRIAKQLSASIIGPAAKSNKKTKKLISKIVGGLDDVDPFYNKEWLKTFHRLSLKNDNVEKEGVPVAGINGDSSTSFVSFGSFLVGLIGTHLSNSGKFDEIQIVSYTANENCGLMSNLNVASFLLPREELQDYLETLFKDGTSLTLEGVISQIIERFISTRLQICYGLSKLYKRDKAQNTVITAKDSDTHEHNLQEMLRYLYVGLATPDAVSNSINAQMKNFNDVRFVLPKIKFTFDTLTSRKSNWERTISRISIFDQNDNPFGSVNTLMKDVYNDGAIRVAAQLNRLRAKYKSGEKGKKGKNGQKIVKEAFYKKSNKILSDLERSGNLRQTSDGIYELVDQFKLDTFKNTFKSVMPSLTYGTQNSAIIDASVSTVNEAKLNTIYLTRSSRNADGKEKKELMRTKVAFQKDLPLRVLPTQAQVTIFGCPFVNFAQYIFLDFETGTTIDNSYAITGIKHDLSPGKFTTQLTLSYGDVYGKYENAASTIARAINESRSQKKVTKAKDPKSVPEVIINKFSKSGPAIGDAEPWNAFKHTFKVNTFVLHDHSTSHETDDHHHDKIVFMDNEIFLWNKNFCASKSRVSSNKREIYANNTILIDSHGSTGKKIKVELDLFQRSQKTFDGLKKVFAIIIDRSTSLTEETAVNDPGGIISASQDTYVDFYMIRHVNNPSSWLSSSADLPDRGTRFLFGDLANILYPTFVPRSIFNFILKYYATLKYFFEFKYDGPNKSKALKILDESIKLGFDTKKPAKILGDKFKKNNPDKSIKEIFEHFCFDIVTGEKLKAYSSDNEAWNKLQPGLTVINPENVFKAYNLKNRHVRRLLRKELGFTIPSSEQKFYQFCKQVVSPGSYPEYEIHGAGINNDNYLKEYQPKTRELIKRCIQINKLFYSHVEFVDQGLYIEYNTSIAYSKKKKKLIKKTESVLVTYEELVTKLMSGFSINNILEFRSE